jgi:HD superfamily phosphohydrolase
MNQNKRKIINDPVYGFITIRHPFILDLIDHPWFQRLRRIAQLGLSHLVYPGAVHNRFQHAIGAMHLMQLAIDELRLKKHEITDEEEVSLLAAVLLHDIGHGPFSHALEFALIQGLHHEDISEVLMRDLNQELGGTLTMAIAIFNNAYPKHFLHQLVSSQLDMDRLDYLARDSFFSGVVEGQVGAERLIKMLNVVDDQLVLEEKGIYSIEKFIVARRFMYWQVYLHKTVLSAEYMLVHVLRRALELAQKGVELFATPALRTFLYGAYDKKKFLADPLALNAYAALDDFDIATSLKVWQSHPDKVLSDLSRAIMNRALYKIELQSAPISEEYEYDIQKRMKLRWNLNDTEVGYYVFTGKVDNRAYNQNKETINILRKDGTVAEVAAISDQLNLAALSNTVEKYFIAYKSR